MIDSANPVLWTRSLHSRLCDECREGILPGDPMAIYDDDAIVDYGNHLRTTRHYCEDCGHLLEDSLTTLEMVP